MSLLQAVILGIIQGLTEFIPISSTAHLRVVPALLDWKDPGAAFTAVIQVGTLGAALVYFRSDIIRLTTGWLKGLIQGTWFSSPDSQAAWLIILGTIPIVIAGLSLKKYIHGPWRSLYVIAASAIIMALILALAEGFVRWRARKKVSQREMGELHWLDAIIVGLFQCIALVPGASRSGVTITGGLFAGLSRYTAARFSFLLSLPSVFAAAMLELYEERHELLATRESILNLVVATAVSAVIGYASIAFLLRYLTTHTTWLFIIYRLAGGILILALLFSGNLKPESHADESANSQKQVEWSGWLKPAIPQAQ